MAKTLTALLVIVTSTCLALPAMANDKLVRLAVPPALVDTGLLKYMLPRFTLKTQIRFEIVAPGDSPDAAIGGDGTPVFSGPDAAWAIDVLNPDHTGAASFRDWLLSETGASAITGYAPDGRQVFFLPEAQLAEAVGPSFTGDADGGRKLASLHCGRCHAVTPGDMMNSIGSTPSFMVLRALPDWSDRFESFYVLNPHPAFTQIAEVTEPFPAHLPSPIVPVEMTLDELDAILAYLFALPPADLGGPLELSDN